MRTFNRVATKSLRRLGAAGVRRGLHYRATDTALILVGTQGDLIGPPDAVVRLARLLDACRGAGLPIIHTQALPPTPGNGVEHPTPSQEALLTAALLMPGAPGAALHPGVAPTGDDTVMAPQAGISPFRGGALAARLHRGGIQRVIIAGARTDVEVDSCARDATELGLQTTVVSDCCTGTTALAHHLSTAVTLPRVVHGVVPLAALQSRLS